MDAVYERILAEQRAAAERSCPLLSASRASPASRLAVADQAVTHALASPLGTPAMVASNPERATMPPKTVTGVNPRNGSTWRC